MARTRSHRARRSAGAAAPQGRWFNATSGARWRARVAIALWSLVALAALGLVAIAVGSGADGWTIFFLVLVSVMMLVYGVGLVVAEGPLALRAETLWIGPDGVLDRRIGSEPIPWSEMTAIEGPAPKKINKRLIIAAMSLQIEAADRWRRAPGLTSVYRKDMKDEDPGRIDIRIDDLDAAPEAVAAEFAKRRPREQTGAGG